MKRLLLGCLLCSIILLSGCSQKLGDFTLLTTKNVDLSNFSTYTPANNQKVRGEDVAHIIICFPNKVPNFKDAIDVALEQNNAYMLTDAVIRHDVFYIPYIYGTDKFIAEGIPVRRTN